MKQYNTHNGGSNPEQPHLMHIFTMLTSWEQIEQILEEGKSFEPSCEEQPSPNNLEDDFETLEISDFEPIQADEKGCSIM
jgi:hypothetical protein